MKQEPKSIVLKFSGEYLANDKEGKIFDQARLEKVADIVIKLHPQYQAMYLVVGGGNITRGRELEHFQFGNGGADIVGMFSTAQNATFLKQVMDKKGLKTHVMAPFSADMLEVHHYQPGKAQWWATDERHLVIFGGGLGLRGFSTDMTMVHRGYEVGADVVVKITEVGGLYTEDPAKNPNATLIEKITFDEVIAKKYRVMDATAFTFAKEVSMPIKIVDLDYEKLTPEYIFNTTTGGTLISDN